MKGIIFFFFVWSTTLLGQQVPQKIERIQPKKTIAENKVKTRIAMVYSYTDSTFYDQLKTLKSDTLSVVSFNKYGQIVQEKSFRDFSDRGDYIKTYSYDNDQRLITKRNLIGDSLAREDQFVYSPGGTLLDWTIRAGGDKVNQEYQYNEHNDPFLITAKGAKGQVFRKDSICYLYDTLGRIKYEWAYNQEGERVDEVVYSYQKQDTVWKKILLKDGLPTAMYAELQKQSLRLEIKTDIVVFEDGWLLATRTKTYDRENNLVQDRLRHPSVEWNYTKNFIYNRDGLLIEKQVYEGNDVPTTVVFYSYDYFKE